MSGILSLLFKAVLGGLVDAFNAWRRDKALENLGYEKAQREQATDALTKANAVIQAQQKIAAVPRLDRDAALERLRAGTF